MKKMVATFLLLLFLLPVVKTNYHLENVGIVRKQSSVISILVSDFKNGTLGTELSP